VKRSSSHIFGALLGAALLIFAVWLLFDRFRDFTLQEFIVGFENVRPHQILLCSVLTAVYYIILSGYDALAFRYIGHPLKFRKIALASFVGYAFSHNVGFSVVSSGSMRYRIYSSFGLIAAEVAKIILFCSITASIGFLTVAGVVFAFFPISVRHTLLHFDSLRPFGIAALLLIALYAWFAMHTKEGVRLRWCTLPHVSAPTMLRQMLLGSCEWILGALIVYSVLPMNAPMSIRFVLEIYLLAQVAGMLSQVPGGIGVFESVLFLLLPVNFPTTHILASLVVYRAVFYLLPLALATVLLATHEVRVKGRAIS
jgi:uncharacterized membrane protein YbhN (UPF0104 family)